MDDPGVWFRGPARQNAYIGRAITHYEGRMAAGANPRTAFTLALVYLNAHRFEDAAARLREVLKAHPDLAVAHAQLQALEPKLAPARPLVAVVDDSPTVRKMVSMKLSEYGYGVVGLADGSDAIARLAQIRPDLILLDINMPGKDGYEVCRWAKSNPVLKEVPIVMLSGADGFFDKIRGRMAGASRHISKPFDSYVLMQVVDLHCPRANRG